MQNFHSMGRRLLVSALALSLMIGSAGLGWADQKLWSLNSGMNVQLESDVSTKTAAVGQTVQAKLGQDVHYHDMTLPAGTTFQGHITEIAHSKPLGRPGYVVVAVDQATLPNGQTFDLSKYPASTRRIHDPEAQPFLAGIAENIPYNLVGLGLTIPLHVAADVSTLSLVPVGLGARMATGSLFGLVRPRYRGMPVLYKVVKGGLDGSGIPTLVRFVSGAEEPDYHAGDNMKLYVNSQGLHDLFQASSGLATTNTRAELGR